MLTDQIAMAEHVPDRPHWTLSFLATEAAHRGTGLARATLEPVLLRASTDGIPVHLFTALASNLDLYARFGFEVVSELDLPDGGPHAWSLVRP
jgi:predicted acetyltransferase